MRILIRIVFVIFIANGIDCFGGVCDNCCDYFKKEIKEDENNTAKSLVNTGWYNAKKENLVLKIFVKEENGIFKDNGNKVSFKLEGNNNPKIAYQNKKKDPLNLEGKKYALFEIKTQEEEDTVYLYCSDVGSSEYNNEVYGIFKGTNHVSISVIACNTTKVTDMRYMFWGCSSLKELDIKNFDTTNVSNMKYMFSECSSLKELDLKNFDTTNVTNMYSMFSGCSRLENLNLNNFNTSKVTDMYSMFNRCSSLKKLYLNNFVTENVTNMSCMFSECSNLTELYISNFNTTNVTDMGYMFCNCQKITKLNLKNFNTENVTNMRRMFNNCRSLTELDIENFNTSKVKDKDYIFENCNNLSKEIKM